MRANGGTEQMLKPLKESESEPGAPDVQLEREPTTTGVWFSLKNNNSRYLASNDSGM